MKIGFDGKRLFHNKTGLGNYSRDLLRIISKHYPTNQFFIYNPKPKKIDRLPIDNHILFEKLPQTAFYKKYYALWRLFGLKNDIERDKIDIYHGLSGEIPLFLNTKITQTVVTIHDLIFMRYPELYSFIDRNIYYWKFKYAAKNAAVVIAISEQTKADIVHYLKINPDKIQVIYQGCAPVFKENITQECIVETKSKYALPDEYLLNVGTIEERKNIFSVVKAILGTTITLVIIGKKANYCTAIMKYIAKNNMYKQVIFLENVALLELAAIYRGAKLFVYPSVFEGFGIPIIEALFSGIPVITNKDGCFREAAGENSVYIESNNIVDIKKNIVALWDDLEKQNQMKIEGLKFVQKFNDEVIAANIIELYSSLLRPSNDKAGEYRNLNKNKID